MEIAQIISLIISSLQLLVMGYLSWEVLKLNRLSIEDPEWQVNSYSEELENDEYRVSLKLHNKGKGKASIRDIAVRCLGEDSENRCEKGFTMLPHTPLFLNPDDKKHLGVNVQPYSNLDRLEIELFTEERGKEILFISKDGIENSNDEEQEFTRKIKDIAEKIKRILVSSLR